MLNIKNVNFWRNIMSTTIRISRENKNKLMNIGCKNETFEDIIMKLYHIRNCVLIKELTDNTANFKTELLRVFELIFPSLGSSI